MRFLFIVVTALFLPTVTHAQSIECKFVTECLGVDELDTCQATTYQTDIIKSGTDWKFQDESGDYPAVFSKNDNGDAYSWYSSSSNGDQRLLTSSNETAHYTIHLPGAALSIHYFGTCTDKL